MPGNAYYTVSGNPTTGAPGASAVVRTEFAAIQAGFALLPQTLTPNAIVVVNSGGTALTVNPGGTTGTGAFVLAGSPTITGHLTLEGQTLTGVTGTGNLVLSASPTITGHFTVEGVTSTGATGSGGFVFSVSPTITGHITLEGVTATGATGTGKFVFDTAPTLGAVTLTSVNKVTVTAPASGATLTIADGKTLTASNSLTFTGADGSPINFGAGGAVSYAGISHPGFVASRFYPPYGMIAGSPTTAGSATTLYYLFFAVPVAQTFTKIGINITSGATGNCRLGIYNCATIPTTLVVDGGTVALSGTGVVSATINQSLASGGYFLAVIVDNTSVNVSGVGTVPTLMEWLYGIGATVTGSAPGGYASTGVTFGALPTPAPSPAISSSPNIPCIFLEL